MFTATEKKGVFAVSGPSTDAELITRIGLATDKPKDLVYVQFSDGKVLGVIADGKGGFRTRAPRSANAAKKEKILALAAKDPKAAYAAMQAQIEAARAKMQNDYLNGLAREIKKAETRVDELRTQYAEAERLANKGSDDSDEFEDSDEIEESEDANESEFAA